MSDRESMEFDVVIVGAGPAGLSTAIKLRQLSQDINVCVIEKGSEVGAHILSGAVIEARALNELFPDWQEKNAPLHTPAIEDNFLMLTSSSSFKLPTPPQMHNEGNYIISLGSLCKWLAEQAENLGVQIFPGFPAKEILYNEHNEVCGVVTNDMGRSKDGSKKSEFQPGIELRAKYTVFSEGCRGSLTRQLFDKYSLREDCDPQTYGIGIKELWEILPEKHERGKVVHTIGWPLDWKTYGGSFIYHLENSQVAIGFVIGLDYENPYLNPYKEFQRFKTHPKIRPLLEGGKRICYGARGLNEGGYQSIPKLTFPGGVIVGDAAGFLNVPKIKGVHTAMKSGIIAAGSINAALKAGAVYKELLDYERNLKHSWVYKELYEARNIRPAFNYGLYAGLAYSALDAYILKGHAPWTFSNHADHKSLKPAAKFQKIEYPKPDGKVTFDLLSSVYISNTNHTENQPVHLTLKDDKIPVEHNLKIYDAPETRYCPAGVYEVAKGESGQPELHIHSQNCIHCKTCDIKDPKQNIVWITPEGGGGPNYSGM